MSSIMQVLVLHYENLAHNLLPEMRKVLAFLKLPADEERLRCMAKHKNGFFQRKQFFVEAEKVPFGSTVRKVNKQIFIHSLFFPFLPFSFFLSFSFFLLSFSFSLSLSSLSLSLFLSLSLNICSPYLPLRTS